MIKIIKEEIEIDESLVSRLNVICDFCNTTPIIENGIMDEKEYTSVINKKENIVMILNDNVMLKYYIIFMLL